MKLTLSNLYLYIPSKKSSAQVDVWVNSVLTRNGCIKCYISLFKGIILQQLDEFKTEIKDSLTQLCAFKVSRGHPSKVVKLSIMSPVSENMEYLNNPSLHKELHLCCVINVKIWFSWDLGFTGFNHFVPLSKKCAVKRS